MQGFLGDDLQVGLPHVRAYEPDAGGTSGPIITKNCSKTANPQQAGHSLIDLAHQGEVVLALAWLNLIDTDGGDAAQRSVRQASFDHVFDGVAHLVPVRQELHVRLGQMMLPAGPRNLLDNHSAGEARFTEMIIARRGLLASAQIAALPLRGRIRTSITLSVSFRRAG